MSEAAIRRRTFTQVVLRDPRALAGAVFLSILFLAAIFAPWIAPHDPNAMDYMMMEEPSLIHPLGVDDLGRDLLSRIIHGARRQPRREAAETRAFIRYAGIFLDRTSDSMDGQNSDSTQSAKSGPQ